MNIDEFWDLIDAARDRAGDRLRPEFTDRFLTALEDGLYALELVEVVEYDARRIELCLAADRPGLRAVNLMVNPSEHDPSEVSEGFVCGLVSLGRATFERALVDPDSLAWEPLIRAIAEGRVPGSHMMLDEMPDMAKNNYESRDDQNVDYQDVDYQEALDTYIVGTDDVEEPSFWDDDPDQVRQRLPRLGAMFAESTKAFQQAAARSRLLSNIGWTLFFAAILVIAIIVSFLARVEQMP